MLTAFVCRTLIVSAYLVPALWHGTGPAALAIAGALLLVWVVPLVRDRRRAVTAAAAAPSSLPG